MKTGQITWSEINGAGTLTLVWDDGTRETVEHAQPIDAATDSHDIANLFGGADVVDHDGDVVHVSREV